MLLHHFKHAGLLQAINSKPPVDDECCRHPDNIRDIHTDCNFNLREQQIRRCYIPSTRETKKIDKYGKTFLEVLITNTSAQFSFWKLCLSNATQKNAINIHCMFNHSVYRLLVFVKYSCVISDLVHMDALDRLKVQEIELIWNTWPLLWPLKCLYNSDIFSEKVRE